jgi:hypothetical protein
MSNFNILGLGKLVIKTVNIDHLYLDPNNPRFMGVESMNITAMNKYTNKKVQTRALTNMKGYGLLELKKNIQAVGFLPIDKMVFVEISGMPNEYYCLEGNRRLAAIKWLLEDQEAGEVEISAEIQDSLKELEVYVLEEVTDAQKAQQLIQGIRHMSGVRDWRPYQKAKVINGLITEGKTATEIGDLFGMTSTAVMRYYRAFLACETFISNDIFGQYWNIDLFRMFDDVMRRPRLRDDWLGWDEKEKVFKNTTELEYFYKWIVPESETDTRKIPGANYIKDLDVIVSHLEALEYLKNEGSTLASALALTRDKHEMPWIAKVEEMIKTLHELDAAVLETMEKDQETKLKELQGAITKALERARKLKA